MMRINLLEKELQVIEASLIASRGVKLPDYMEIDMSEKQASELCKSALKKVKATLNYKLQKK